MQNYELHNYAFCSMVNNSRDLMERWVIIDNGIKKVINPTYAFFSNACIGTIVTDGVITS